MTKTMTIDERVEQVQKLLDDNHIYGTAYHYAPLPVVVVLITWGDWKHDHLRADLLIEEIGGVLVKKATTEEDGTDCYSGEHYYIFN